MCGYCEHQVSQPELGIQQARKPQWLLLKCLANASAVLDFEIIFLVDNQSSGACKGWQENPETRGRKDANSSISSFQPQVKWRSHLAAALRV